MHQAFFCSHCGVDLRKDVCECDYQTGDSMPPVSTAPIGYGPRCLSCGEKLSGIPGGVHYCKGAKTPPNMVYNSPFDRQEGGEHYKGYAIQPAAFCHLNKIPKLEGDAIYYILRWRDKNGLADLDKAIHTLQLIKELETEGEKPCRTTK